MKLEYTISGKSQVMLEEAENYKVLFYDLFSETCNYLRQNGFNIDFKVDWIEGNLKINREYMDRIMDNIVSNILKYADPKENIVISSEYYGEKIGFSFQNAVKKIEEKIYSTQVGIESIKSMMAKMNGNCVIEIEEDKFYIEIIFPLFKYSNEK